MDGQQYFLVILLLSLLHVNAIIAGFHERRMQSDIEEIRLLLKEHDTYCTGGSR